NILVREVLDLYLSGIRSYTIAQQLNATGKLIDNKKWDSTKICHLLRNKRCKGEYTSNRTERNFDEYEIIKCL
ncbi:recombinase family protein, partial [Serratia sp. OS31]|uniref:recombinase family protein n=1 Tax=Serratia sp. OS31 TaxID=2760844 RepID=UPI0016037915